MKLLLNLNLLLKYIKAFGFRHGVSNFFRVLSSKGEAIVFVNGSEHALCLRRGTSDVAVFNQVFLDQEYKYPLAANPRFIIDGGANIGLTSVFFSIRYPDALIVAVEPEESNYEMLVRNTKGFPTIHCLKAGLWNSNTFLKVENAAADKWEFTFVETNKQPGAVEAISIGSIMKKFNCNEVDILKMDIEGSEREVFSSGYEEWLPQTKAIMIELHDNMRNGCSKSFFMAIGKYDFSFDVRGKGKTIVCTRN